MPALQGERDHQVTMIDVGKWNDTLGSRADAVFHSDAPVNHLFMPGRGPANPGEYGVAGHVLADVIRDIARWIKEQR